MIDDSQQNIALGVIVAFPILGGIAVLLRLWSRYLARSALTSDDYLVSAGYILAVIQSLTSWYYVKTNYTGIHIWDVPKDFNPKQGLIWNFANQLLYNPALTLVKVSILMFLRRLESKSRLVKSLIWISLAVTIGLCISVLLVDLFQCSPVAFVYDKTVPGGKCIHQGAFYVSTAAFNLFTDLLVLSIPIIITWSLHMPTRRKIAVCIILCMGVVATAVGVWRIVMLANAFFPGTPSKDPTYNIGFCSSAVEVNVAVMTACAPSMKAITSKYLPRLLGTSRNGSSGYGANNSSSQYRSGKPQLYSNNTDDYEMADPYRADVDIKAAADREMKKYIRGDSHSLTSEEDAEGRLGIIKTTDVSVQYANEERQGSGSRKWFNRRAIVASMDSFI
ncbi:hypothetical protein ASPWEDRAFT_173550 [Aspergillus wentii DTO 134E9]|uniref:Rhodopsin domain-containing protein n=1 Tax=Aspergillus wentii DTO 134E9 TaxID=1073089 RepID=A0A1L9RH00_ASPWE|nr:uncharacterized protein ASPWEDRAFT_173550 [Aspergillus wentii DTO 134E9]KAI9927899.1 hypothetical protein MW887_002751 [Aspergillus wentii]OJJ34123.1 hypothetical protein ASPWEDRAFT_173550 [Aspergillus wentii DTO 134E9]